MEIIKIPHFAWGIDNNMIENRLVGKTIICHICGKRHKVMKNYDGRLQFIRCGNGEYLAGVDGYRIILKDKKK